MSVDLALDIMKAFWPIGVAGVAVVYVYAERNSKLARVAKECERNGERIEWLKHEVKERPTFTQCKECRRECSKNLRDDLYHEIDLKFNELKRCLHVMGSAMDKLALKIDEMMKEVYSKGERN